jgi:hypothetical protein
MMTTAKQGMLITHAIALTALLLVGMGWQAQIQQKVPQARITNPVEVGLWITQR